MNNNLKLKYEDVKNIYIIICQEIHNHVQKTI